MPWAGEEYTGAMFFKWRKNADDSQASGSGSGASATPAAPGSQRSSRSPVDLSGESSKGLGNTTQFLTGEANQDRRNVQVLLETIARVSMSRDLDSLLTYVVDSSIKLTGAERGLLIMGEGQAEDLRYEVRTGRTRDGRDVGAQERYSTSVAAKVLELGEPVRATVHSESEALELGKSVYDLKLRAVMCVPLSPPENAEPEAKLRGVLYVDSRAASRQFTQGDLALFAALAQQISIAMDNARLHLDSLEKVRLEQSMELASVIQRDLMPGVPKGIPGWDVHGWYRPAEDAAGDFYDFVKTKQGQHAIVVGDASGHGIGPALITATCQGSLRSYLRLIEDPGQVLTLLNDDLCERMEDGRFLTLYLAMLGDEGQVIGLNAGHAFPFIWRKASGEIEELGAGGPALGMIPGVSYEAHPTVRLDSGDVLMIYTDGLSEARALDNPEVLFGEEGVKQCLARSAAAGRDAKGIITDMVEEALALSHGAREDDITIVVARRK